MSEAALSRIANLISVEDDLSKIENLRQQFIKEKAATDNHLKDATEDQIKSITSNIDQLNRSTRKLNNIKSEINKINDIHTESITNFTEYDMVDKMTQVNQYFGQVKNLYQDISNFNRNLDNIHKLIQTELDIVLNDLSYPLNYIFKIHYNTTQVRNLQDYLEVESGNLSDDLRSLVLNITQPLRKVVQDFDKLLAEIIISATEAFKIGNTELVFKLVKIIDYESEEDTKLILKQELNLSTNPLNVNYGQTRLRKRNYKKFFYDKLESSLVDTFTKCIEHFQDDKMAMYDGLDWLEDELLFVNDTFSQVFPKSWEVNSFIQNVYYNQLHNFTMDIVNTDPPAEDLLKILSYDSHYNKFLAALQPVDDIYGAGNRKSVIKTQQKSIIGEDLKNNVLQDYLRVIVSKMDEWNENLITQELHVFKEREAPPDLYNYSQEIEDLDARDQPVLVQIETSVYVLPDFRTPLKMLKEQADAAADSGYGKILVGVIEHWSKCHISRIARFQELIQVELENYMSIYNNDHLLRKKSRFKRLFGPKEKDSQIQTEDLPQEELSKISREGLVEYLCALGNTFVINTDRLQDKFLPSYKDKVHATYQGNIEQSFRDTLIPSTELNASIITSLVDIITNDLSPALSKIFEKQWYEKGKDAQFGDDDTIADSIVQTIIEYMEEMRQYTCYDIYLVTFTIMLDRFICTYIRCGYENILIGGTKKFDPLDSKRYKTFSDAISRDIDSFFNGLSPLMTRKDTAYLVSSLRAIELLVDLAFYENPMENIPQIWEMEILPVFYNCSVEYVRGILMCRKDMDKNLISLLINQLVKIQKQYHQEVEIPENPTLTLDEFEFESKK